MKLLKLTDILAPISAHMAKWIQLPEKRTSVRGLRITNEILNYNACTPVISLSSNFTHKQIGNKTLSITVMSNMFIYY